MADVSLINADKDGRPTPNPNVLIELGYAISFCGWDRILLVCNEEFGPIGELPFDIPERRVIAYTLPVSADADKVKDARERG